MQNYGYIPSVMDGTEHLFSASMASSELPDNYSYRDFLSPVLNQGANPICVPCSISAYLNWRENMVDGNEKDNKIAYFEIYDSKTTYGDGMTFKDALHFLRHNGVNSKLGNLKINEYAIVNNSLLLKYALISNGPCIGALPVYNGSPEFWNKNINEILQGYHAISIVGYDNNGFYIRNSWGTIFGDNGYTYIKNVDFNKFIEIWTII